MNERRTVDEMAVIERWTIEGSNFSSDRLTRVSGPDLVRDLYEHVEATDVKRPESMGPLKVAVRARDFLTRTGGWPS